MSEERLTTLAHHEAAGSVAAPATQLFDYLDLPDRLGAHMTRPNWRTAGMRMSYEFDLAHGRAVGARIALRGNVLGLELHVEEIVVERDPPRRKRWRTTGTPRLLVLRHYEMGYEIAALDAECCRLRVFLDYQPTAWPLGALARPYARWCVDRMLVDAQRRFGDA